MNDSFRKTLDVDFDSGEAMHSKLQCSSQAVARHKRMSGSGFQTFQTKSEFPTACAVSERLGGT